MNSQACPANWAFYDLKSALFRYWWESTDVLQLRACLCTLPGHQICQGFSALASSILNTGNITKKGQIWQSRWHNQTHTNLEDKLLTHQHIAISSLVSYWRYSCARPTALMHLQIWCPGVYLEVGFLNTAGAPTVCLAWPPSDNALAPNAKFRMPFSDCQIVQNSL